MVTKVVPLSPKLVHLGPRKRVIIEANDDDTFLDPDGSPCGAQMGSKAVPLSPKLGVSMLYEHIVKFNRMLIHMYSMSEVCFGVILLGHR